MDPATVQAGDTYYLVHASGHKFWEITIFDNSTHVRYGKLRLGEEDAVEAGDSFFHTQDDALRRARELLIAKMERGYRVLSAEDGEVTTVDLATGEFAKAVQKSAADAGTVVELQDGPSTNYCKVQVHGQVHAENQVRVEKGIEGGRPAAWVNTYVNDEEAVRAAKMEIREKLARGYRRKTQKTGPPEIIEIDLETESPAPPTPKIASTDLAQTLAGTGLERYASALEAEHVTVMQISVEELPVMSEDDFLRIGIPPSASAKLTSHLQTPSPQVLPKKSLKRSRKDSDSPAQQTPPGKKSKVMSSASTDSGGVPEFVDLLLAQSWDQSVNPKGWLLSEKLDGVRCYWNGKQLISRQGHPYAAPGFFVEGFPIDNSLDGELWLGRKLFQKCVSIVRRSDAEKHDFEEWKQIKYVLFDAPSLKRPFEERLAYLKSVVETVKSPYLVAHEHVVCRDVEHLNSELKRISDLGGEGLMLRQAGSLYEFKRSKTLLKVKMFQDAEAVVVGYEPGKGKNEGLVGAMKVRTDDGREFKVGTGLSDADRKNPPPIGSRITYKFQELSTAGIPRFPSFLRERHDL